MKADHRSLVPTLIAVTASLAMVATATAQTYPRATGISVSNVQRSGFTVSFDVTMTTTQTSNSAFNPGRLGNTVNSTTSTFTSPTALQSGAPLLLTYRLFDFQGNMATVTNHALYAATTTTSITTFDAYRRFASTFVGPLPAIDFGDGSTVPVTTLTSASTTYTGTSLAPGFTTRVFRGSFMHTYADHGEYTIRVGSPPFSPANAGTLSPTYGTALTRNAYPVRWTFGGYTDFAFPSAAFTDVRTTRQYNYGQGTTATSSTSVYFPAGGTVRNGNVTSNYLFDTGGAVAQLAATADASFAVIEVPTASAHGLLALGLLLAGAGLLLLRR